MGFWTSFGSISHVQYISLLPKSPITLVSKAPEFEECERVTLGETGLLFSCKTVIINTDSVSEIPDYPSKPFSVAQLKRFTQESSVKTHLG